MTTELEYSAEQTSRKELSDVYARLQAAHQIIGYLVTHLRALDNAKDESTLMQLLNKPTNDLIKRYGDINGN